MSTSTIPKLLTLPAEARIVLIRVKIERAKKHLSDLEAAVAEFRHTRMTVISSDLNAKTRKPFGPATFHDLPVMPFDVISTAGDVIQNLRSALDHLANQLVIVGSGREPNRRIEFPIAKDLHTYEATKRKKVEGMGASAIQAIDALKPYNGGNENLWKIHELNNIDKHRNLFTVARDCLFSADWMPGDGFPFWVKSDLPHFSGVFDDEVENEMQFEIDKALLDSGVPANAALLPTLHQLVAYVEKTVVSFTPLLDP